jgi:hypothetical protein
MPAASGNSCQEAEKVGTNGYGKFLFFCGFPKSREPKKPGPRPCFAFPGQDHIESKVSS